MTKNLKNWFNVARILSLITTIVSVVMAFLLFLEIPFMITAFENAYYLLFKNPNPSEFSYLLSAYVWFLLFSTLINYWAGKLYKILSTLPTGAIVHKSSILNIISAIQLLFGIMLFPPITMVAPLIGTIGGIKLLNLAKKHKIPDLNNINSVSADAIFIKNENAENETNPSGETMENTIKPETDKNKETIEINPEVQMIMAERIKELKRDKEKGLIAEDEYLILLNKILEGNL